MKSIRHLRSNKIHPTSRRDSDEYTDTIQQKCSSSNCVRISNECLTYHSFDRKVHYACSKLPVYFIQVLIEKSSKQQFICCNCVTVSKDLVLATETEIEKLKEDIKKCENVIKASREKELSLEKKVTKHQQELKDLKSKLKQDPGIHTVEYLEAKFEMKVDEIKNVIAESMKSYATVTKINTAERPTEKQFTNIIQEAKTKELLEQQQKKQKSKNIIIHGLAENKDLECDEGFVRQLLHDLKVKDNVKHVMRIGAHETQKDQDQSKFWK